MKSDLIDACVVKSYFREHMAERDVLFNDTMAPHFASTASPPPAPTSSPSSNRRAVYEAVR